MSDTEKLKLEALDLPRLVTNLPGFIYICDYDEHWTMRFVSEGCRAILGYSPDDLIGNRVIAFSDLIHPNDQEAISVSAEKNLAEHKPCEYEYRITTASGSEKWVWERSHGIYDESGKVTRIEGYIEDITARKNVRDLRRLIDRSPAVHYVARATGDFGAIYISDGVRAQLGHEPSQFTEDSAFWVSQLHPDDQARVLADMEETLTKDQSVLEYRFQHADGSWRWMHDEHSVLRDEEGNALQIVGTWLDITKRKSAEEALWENERLLREAQRIARIGNWEWDIVNNELSWSDEIYRIFGVDREQFKPSYEAYRQSLHPEDRARVTAAVNRALNGGEKYSIDFRIRLRDGTDKVVHSEGEVTLNQEGRAVRMTGTAQDVTEQAQLERDLLTTKEQERARIGHDLHDGLGQELTGISLRLRSLGQILASERSPHVQAIDELIALLQNAIGETRRVARVLSPGFSTALGFGVALKALAEEVNTHSEVKCRVERLSNYEPQDVEVAAHLYRITQEAINNALRHSNAQNIDVRLSRDGDLVTLEILDDGIGIPPPSSRVEGVGLKSMHYRARIIHGYLDVAPRTQGGTRVSLTVPLEVSRA
jgi:PAS domain S-box-containing protein